MLGEGDVLHRGGVHFDLDEEDLKGGLTLLRFLAYHSKLTLINCYRRLIKTCSTDNNLTWNTSGTMTNPLSSNDLETIIFKLYSPGKENESGHSFENNSSLLYLGTSWNKTSLSYPGLSAERELRHHSSKFRQAVAWCRTRVESLLSQLIHRQRRHGEPWQEDEKSWDQFLPKMFSRRFP